MIHIADILEFLRAEGIPFTFSGDESAAVDRFSSLSNYREGTFTWVKKQENVPSGFDLARIALAFVSEDVEGAFQSCIRTAQSKRAFFSTIEHFYAIEEERPAVGQFTYISPKVKLGKNVRIGHNCTLDGEITIGDGTIIWNNVTIINRVSIGKNCIIQSGTVIGHDGYGYSEDEDHVKTMVQHFGGVTIGDNVRMGMNNVIARGTIDDTVIMDGVKMGDLCHVGHNNIIGKNAALVTAVVVYGSCRIHDDAYVASSVIRNQSTVGNDAFIGMGSVVVKDVPANETVVGNPARPFRKKA